MTTPSPRYVYALSTCLLLALVPVVVHSYKHLQSDDCQGARAFITQSAPESVPGQKRAAWMREHFDSDQWAEGSFVKEGLHFDFSLIRSYDAKRLYHFPENYFVERAYLKNREIEWLPTASGALPIHRAYYSETAPVIVVAYLLVYHSAPVANPYWAQLRAAPVELIGGRRPMTLFLIHAQGPPGSGSRMENVAREWLGSEWASYRRDCAR